MGLVIVAMVLGGVGVVPNSRGQGGLIPPGAPAPSMKTLAQIEPRVPITNVPYTITQPGSYYVTTNLVTTGHGIIIRASRVTVDLMGFSLNGDRNASEYGIWLDGATNGAVYDVVVRGGSVSAFEIGVRLEYARGCKVEGMVISSNANSGVSLWGGSGVCNGNMITGCTIRDNTYGVAGDGTSGACDGNTIAGCVIIDNAGKNVQFGVGSGTCNGNTVRDCAIIDAGGEGVYLKADAGGTCNGNMLRDCLICGGGYQGVSIVGSPGICNGNTVTGCAITSNGMAGVMLSGFDGECNGNTIRDCTLTHNNLANATAAAIFLFQSTGKCDGNVVAHCVLRGNRTCGILCDGSNGNRIENNHVSGTTGVSNYGIRTTASSGNLVLQNSCVGQTNNFSFSASDSYGPVVTASGAFSTTNGAAALSPWANFSR